MEKTEKYIQNRYLRNADMNKLYEIAKHGHFVFFDDGNNFINPMCVNGKFSCEGHGSDGGGNAKMENRGDNYEI